jgi:hypothetical protein
MTTTGDIKASMGAKYDYRELGGSTRSPAVVNRILVPTDLTNESQGAIEFGLVLAQHIGAHLTLLHVYKQPYSVEYLRGSHISDEV